MKKVAPPRPASAGLRRQAEERLDERARRGEVDHPSAADAQRFVHELQVHQIELELQNEELERARGELEVGLQRYAELYDFAPVGYLTVGRNGAIRKANLAGARLLGLERSRLVGTRLALAVAEGSRASFDSFLVKVFGGRAKQACEVELQAREGAARWLHLEAAASDDGEECRTVLMDITERQRAEDALRAAEQRRTDFLAVLSHELRNPLTPITSSLFILESAAPGSDQARRAQAVVARQVGQLTRLVDDLLDVTRISRDKIRLQRERLDLNELVRGLADDLRPEFEAGEVLLEVAVAPAPVVVHADRNRLAQVVGNLLHNAAKFTGRKGSTRASVSADPDQQRAVLQVKDTGAGISAQMLPRLFEPFSQADRTLDRSKGGLGLGLALVRGLVELHGGEVSVHSAGLGKGATFTVWLPLDLSEATAAPPMRAEAERSSRRVLLIEDNLDIAQSLSEALELFGHEVSVAHDGIRGVERARALRPEVVLCDIGLPGMDGYEVARAFRRDEALRGTYLVALTGYAAPEDLQRAREAGFDRHLTKPPTLEKLEDLLADAPRGDRDAEA